MKLSLLRLEFDPKYHNINMNYINIYEKNLKNMIDPTLSTKFEEVGK